MKKTIILAGFALMAAFSSCNKSEMPEAATTDGIKLNITVADMSPETKAVKKGWENGDRLNLYFEGWNEFATSDNYQKAPDMILKYDGSKWQIESQVSSLSSRLKESGGKFTALWESGNYLMGYSLKWYNGAVWYEHSRTKNQYNSYQDTYHSPMVVYSAGVEYTFDGSTLAANITSWEFATKFKVLVKTNDAGLKGKANDLVLQVKVGEDKYASPKGAIVADKNYIMTMLNSGDSNYVGMQGAVAESDGLAFYYRFFEATDSDNIVFTLIDASNGNKKQYPVTGKSLNATEDSFKAISIDYSKFKEGAADIPDGCVDLGLSVCWASCNLGAGKPEEYGDYYAWGETEPKESYSWSTYKFGTSSSGPFSKYNTNSSYGSIDNKTVLEPEDDVAHVKLGGKWQMPTEAEWNELRNTSNCSWTWTTINGVNGYKVQSKKSGYTDNWIFLPAAGYLVDTDLNVSGSGGFYWSSSLSTGGPSGAWGVRFYSVEVHRNYSLRYHGYSVRPVSE